MRVSLLSILPALGIRKRLVITFVALFLALLVALELATLFGAPFTAREGVIRRQRTAQLQNLSLVADTQQALVLRFVQDRLRLAGLAATSPTVAQCATMLAGNVPGAAECRESLRVFFQAFQTEAASGRIRLLGARGGNLLWSTDPAETSGNFALRDFFVGALASRHDSVGLLAEPGSAGPQTLVFCRAIPGPGGAPLALLALETPAEELGHLLEVKGGPGNTGEILIVDQAVRPLAAPRQALKDGSSLGAMERPLPDKGARLAAQGQDGATEYEDYAGNKVWAVYRHIRISSGWNLGLVVKRNQEEIMAPLRDEMLSSLGLTLAVAVAATLLVWLAARGLTGPLQALAEAARRVAQGDLTARAPVLTRDETGELATTFNAMLDELDAARADLTRKVEERTADLRQRNIWLRDEIEERRRTEGELLFATRAAQTADRAKGEFLANMSHELRTPLNGVLGMLHLLSRTGLTEAQAEYAQVAVTSARGLLALLNDILDLSRIESGSLELTPSEFIPAEVMDNLEALLAPAARDKGLEFSMRSDPDAVARLVGDPGRLRQVLFNLLDNAIKFTASGRVSASLEALPALASDGEKGLRLVFTVEDSGVGVEPGRLADIFMPFTQVDSASNRRFGGTGLGLAIVQRLAALMQAHICFSSQPGQGSQVVFSLVLPLARSLSAGPILTSRNLGEPALGPGLRILVAEDDPVSQLSIRRVLESEGHTARCVSNGREALSALARERYDVVIMDIQMPVMNGMEAAAAIRAGVRGVLDRNIPIIALTAYALPGDRETFLAAGMDDYLSKPVIIDVLNSAIDRALNGRRT